MANGDQTDPNTSPGDPSNGSSNNDTNNNSGNRRPSKLHNDVNNHPASSGPPWGWIILAILIAILLAGTAWFIYARLRARRNGTAGPSLNPFSDRNRVGGLSTRSGGLVGWVQEKFAGLSRQRTAGGAYEGTTDTFGASGRGTRGLDPDEAWDTRMGTEADVYGGPVGFYEEQEYMSGMQTGISDAHGDSAYAGGGYGRPGLGYGPPGRLDEIELGDTRGRRSELDERYELETAKTSTNPFEDPAEPSNVSLRGVSPRPQAEESPTERRSMFKENV